jgi:ubiquinone/menaquinone biosynthesis C-methylase UbiE
MTNEASEYQTAQSAEYNFVAFSRDKAYREANRALILEAFSYLPASFFQVDVASGTGLVPQEVGILCQAQGKTATIIGIDSDRFALENARRNTPSTPHCTVEFVEGRGQDIAQLLKGKIPREGVDYTSIHDAIHEIRTEEDKKSVLSSMASILRPGGIFTYNSAFTTVAMENSAMEWGRLKSRAFSILGGKRDKQIGAIKIHTPEQYRQMIVNAGLLIIRDAKRTVIISRTALEAISRYPALIEGVFGDMVGKEKIPLNEMSQALIEAIDSLAITEIPRVWHEIIAQR